MQRITIIALLLSIISGCGDKEEKIYSKYIDKNDYQLSHGSDPYHGVIFLWMNRDSSEYEITCFSLISEEGKTALLRMYLEGSVNQANRELWFLNVEDFDGEVKRSYSGIEQVSQEQVNWFDLKYDPFRRVMMIMGTTFRFRKFMEAHFFKEFQEIYDDWDGEIVNFD